MDAKENTAVWSMTQEILDQIKAEAYKEGVTDALSELSSIFEGVEDTDLWAEYMEEEEGE